MQFILTSSIEKLYTFTLSEQALCSLEQVLDEYMGFYVDRRFHALKVLEENFMFAAQAAGKDI